MDVRSGMRAFWDDFVSWTRIFRIFHDALNLRFNASFFAVNATDHPRLAAELAERSVGWVRSTPLLGAVLVKDGCIIGQGWLGVSRQNQMAGRIHLAQEPGQHLQRHHTGLIHTDQIYRRSVGTGGQDNVTSCVWDKFCLHFNSVLRFSAENAFFTDENSINTAINIAR